MRVLEYLDRDGRSAFGRWLEDLDSRAAAKVTIALTRLMNDNLSSLKSVGSGVLESRIDFGPGYRIYLGRDGDTIVILLGGGTSSGSKEISRLQSCAGTTTGRGRRNGDMALTRDFKETVKARAERDAKFRAALLTEAVEQMLSGDVETGKAVLRDYINATVGFERLARETGTPAKSLMRMFGPNGNPRADNLFAVISRLQKVSGIRLGVAAAK